jgi:hypothetical protein
MQTLISTIGKSIGKIRSWLLIVPSMVVGVVAVEVLCDLFLPARYTNIATDTQRIVFFDGPSQLFQVHEDIFTYFPNSEIRNLTVFYWGNNKYSIEYDYRFRTNNFGLVQDTDVLPDRDTLLVIGDSFTEGQGAEPWFDQVSPEITKLGYQGVNGGLMGTGFAQWEKLQQYLATQKFQIRKVLVVFISDDYRRPIAHLTPGVFQCLSMPALCRVEDSYFYRLPPPNALASWITKIRIARAATVKKSWLAGHAETLLPATYHIYWYFKNKYYGQRYQDPAEVARWDQAGQQSHAAIVELIGKYGRSNVAFLHLPQKDEIGGDPIDIGLKARHSIEESGGRLFDGFKLCGLAPHDYYRNDGHPNPGGYAKIAACVSKLIRQM